MLDKTRGIVLHHYKYGETSLITHIFTRKLGRRSFLIKGARSKRSRLKANIFQPLNILDLEFYHKENQELLLVKEASRAKAFNHFPFEVKKSSQAMFMAEVLHKCLIEEAPHVDLFDFLENAIEYFDLMKVDSSNFHLAFLMKLTQYLGILPPIREANGIKQLNIDSDDPRKPRRSVGASLQSGHSFLLYLLISESFEKCSLHSLSHTERNSILDEILAFYTDNGYKLDKLKSYPVLKTLFSE